LNYLLIFVFIHACFCYSIIIIPPNYFLSQVFGIAIVGVYFYNIFFIFSYDKILAVYLKFCVFFTIIGFPMYFLDINLQDGRFQSIFLEPAHFVIVVIPACFYYLKKSEYFKFIIIFTSLILSNSTLGYLGCGLMFVLPYLNLKRIKQLLYIFPFIAIIFYSIYANFEFLRIRVDDSIENLNVLNNGKFKDDANLSSYAMLSNLYITKLNIIEHPLGSGIGSHHYMYTKNYFQYITPPWYIKDQDRHLINSYDANSLFTRIISELGLFGLIFVIIFIAKSYSFSYLKNNYICQGIFVYFLLKLFRDGSYFPPELFFFIWLFYFSIKTTNLMNNESK
jgi:hypothetical protein